MWIDLSSSQVQLELGSSVHSSVWCSLTRRLPLEGSRAAVGQVSGMLVEVVSSKTISSRLGPVIGLPSALVATGKSAPMRVPSPLMAMSPCQPLHTTVYPWRMRNALPASSASPGSRRPWATAAMYSYGPAVPKLAPPNASVTDLISSQSMPAGSREPGGFWAIAADPAPEAPESVASTARTSKDR